MKGLTSFFTCKVQCKVWASERSKKVRETPKRRRGEDGLVMRSPDGRLIEARRSSLLLARGLARNELEFGFDDAAGKMGKVIGDVLEDTGFQMQVTVPWE